MNFRTKILKWRSQMRSPFLNDIHKTLTQKKFNVPTLKELTQCKKIQHHARSNNNSDDEDSKETIFSSSDSRTYYVRHKSKSFLLNIDNNDFCSHSNYSVPIEFGFQVNSDCRYRPKQIYRLALQLDISEMRSFQVHCKKRCSLNERKRKLQNIHEGIFLES